MISRADIQGHWVRHWIKAPGFKDHTTRVHWMQVGLEYADVRVPLDRPAVPGCLADLSADALLRLAAAEGFAGHVTLGGTHCTWHREINWHGVPDAIDVGDISFDAEGRMIEAGVLAEYAELWENRGAGEGQAMRFNGAGYAGFLMTRGDRFVLGIGAPEKPATGALIDALRAGHIPTDIATLFDGIHAVGHWSGSTATADLATQSMTEGRVVVTLQGDAVTWHRIGFDGQADTVEMTLETVVA